MRDLPGDTKWREDSHCGRAVALTTSDWDTSLSLGHWSDTFFIRVHGGHSIVHCQNETQISCTRRSRNTGQVSVTSELRYSCHATLFCDCGARARLCSGRCESSQKALLPIQFHQLVLQPYGFLKDCGKLNITTLWRYVKE